MSEHFFGVSRDRISDELAHRVNEIAEEHGAYLVVVHNLPGTGYQRWFACRNRGSPFDDAVRDEVYAAIKAAGIELP